LAQPPTRNVRRLQASIVKAASRVPIRALERLERAAGKLARRVLRGLRHEVAYMFVVHEYS
jgi:hypothetical protein